MTVYKFTLGDVERELDMESFRLSEADELLRATGWDYAEWRTELRNMHPDAVRFAWLLANRRAGTPLEVPFREIDFDYKDFLTARVDDPVPQPVEGVEGEGPTGASGSSAEGGTATT